MTKNANLAIFSSRTGSRTVGTLKFSFGDLLLFGLLFKILMMDTLDEFSVYFVVNKLLILAYFWATNLTNFLIKICRHFKMC